MSHTSGYNNFALGNSVYSNLKGGKIDVPFAWEDFRRPFLVSLEIY